MTRRTNGSLVSENCRISDPLLPETNCPSSGWQAIGTYLSVTNDLLPLHYQSQYGSAPSSWGLQVLGANSLRQLFIMDQPPIHGPSGYDPSTAAATTQQSAVADPLSTTGTLWNIARQNLTTRGHGSVLDQLDAVHSITTGYYQPYTIASCEHDIFYGYEDKTPVAFPPPPGSTTQMLNTSIFNDSILSGHAFVYPNITRSQILDTPGSLNDYRLRWIELPQDPFNGTAIGAAVLLPRDSENTTQKVLMCNLGAGWGTSRLNTSSFGGGSTTILSEEYFYSIYDKE